MGKFIVKDRWPELFGKIELATDAALANMAMDIERLAKQRVPVKQGRLLDSGNHNRVGLMHFQVTFNTKYALYQEEGMRQDGSRIVRHYTKPGTGAHYLGDAGKIISSQAEVYFKAAREAVTL